MFVCMNAQISEKIRAKATKFGNSTHIYLQYLIAYFIIFHAHLKRSKSNYKRNFKARMFILGVYTKNKQANV